MKVLVCTNHQSGRGAPRAPLRGDRAGFVLLEVILATALLAVGLFALVDSLSNCVAAARSVQNYSQVETLLANKSFEFRIERPTDYADQEGEFDEFPGFHWSRVFEETDEKYLWKQTITVYWQERGQWVTDAVVEYRYLPQKSE